MFFLPLKLARRQNGDVLEDLVRFEIENGQSEMFTLDKDAVLKVMPLCFLDEKENNARIKIMNGLQSISNALLLRNLIRNGFGSTRMGDNFIETLPPLNDGFVVHIETVIVPYGFKEYFELFRLVLSYEELGKGKVRH